MAHPELDDAHHRLQAIPVVVTQSTGQRNPSAAASASSSCCSFSIDSVPLMIGQRIPRDAREVVTVYGALGFQPFVLADQHLGLEPMVVGIHWRTDHRRIGGVE